MENNFFMDWTKTKKCCKEIFMILVLCLLKCMLECKFEKMKLSIDDESLRNKMENNYRIFDAGRS